MVNSSMMEFQDRPLAVVCPLGWTRGGHLNHVLELLAGFDDQAGHLDACAELLGFHPTTRSGFLSSC